VGTSAVLRLLRVVVGGGGVYITYCEYTGWHFHGAETQIQVVVVVVVVVVCVCVCVEGCLHYLL
jgi:hypothetical protein